MKGINKYLFLLVFLSFILPSATWAFSANLEAIGGSGSVLVKREGKEMRLKQGDSLQLGDEVSTDKSTAVDIRFDDQTILRLGVNSSYKITEDAKSKKLFHRFLSGIIRVLVPVKKEANKGETRFRMSTPEATIGVRGTEFVVIRGGDETKIKGLTGEVLFAATDADFDKQNSFVGVGGGFESSVKKGAKEVNKPTKFALPEYLKQLEKKEGNPFGPLYARTKSSSKAKTVVAQADVGVAGKAGSASGTKPAKSQRFVKKAVPGFAGPSIGNKKINDILGGAVKVNGKTGVVKLDPNGELMMAALSGDEAMAKKALEAGHADVKFQDKEGNSVLHYASIHGKADLIENVLVPNGADVDAVNKAGQTALMRVAAETGSLEMAKALIELGADPSLEDSNGLTALDYAVNKEAKDDEEAARFDALADFLHQSTNEVK